MRDESIVDSVASENAEGISSGILENPVEGTGDPLESPAQENLDGQDQQGDGEGVDTDEIDDILGTEVEDDDSTEESKKDNVQRRIDKLTAEKAELQRKLEEKEAQETQEKPDGTEKKQQYTQEQLKGALRKAMDEGDSDLVWEIMDYRVKQGQEELVDRYTKEQNKNVEVQKAIQQDWDSICDTYDKYRDPKGEIYAGSSKDLDLRDASSLLYQVSLRLYYDKRMEKLYRVPGGQARAVADALTKILAQKAGKDPEKIRLKNKLKKAKQKSNVAGGGDASGAEATSSKPMTQTEKLADAIADRKKFKNERI